MFCKVCGRVMVVKTNWAGDSVSTICPKNCKPKTERTKIGKWSGQSKTPYGKYEER